jgi:tetratricopeptide (TPR) repeat protein
VSYECSQCGYAFEPLADEAMGPFCDCPRCGGLAVEQQGRAATAKAAPASADDADPFAEPENILDPFGGKTGALPLSPSLFGNYFAEAASTGAPPPARGGGSPFDHVDDGPQATGDIHREPTLLLDDDAPAPARAPAPSPRLAPREVTIPGLSDQKVRAAAGDLLDARPRAGRQAATGRDIHDELTNLADEGQRPRPAARRPLDVRAATADERLRLALEPAAQPQVEFGRPAEEPATFNMRIGEDGAAREVSDPAARAPRADIDIFGADERASDDESTVVSPEPEPGAFDVDVDVDAGEADRELERAAETAFPTADEEEEDLEADADTDAAPAAEPADDDETDGADEIAAQADGSAYADEDDDDPLSWNESALPVNDGGLDALAEVDDDEAALDLDDAFIQQLPRPPGMPEARAAGMPEGSSPFASLLSGDMLVSADREAPPSILVSGVHATDAEMLVSGDHALPAEDGGILADDDELSEVSDRLRTAGAGAAEGDWVVAVPKPPPPPRGGKARPDRAVDEVAGLQLPALELPEDHAADKPPPPKTELKLKAERKAKGKAGPAPAAKVQDDTPKAPRFFSGTLFFIVLLVALATAAAGVGAGFALVNAQKKAAPLTGPAKARQLLGEAHRLLHEEQPRQALDLLKRAATDDPTLAEIQRAMGTAHAKLGNEEEAARAYSYYVRLAPNAPDAEAIRLMLARHRGEEP